MSPADMREAAHLLRIGAQALIRYPDVADRAMLMADRLDEHAAAATPDDEASFARDVLSRDDDEEG
jgi:hypothetical protein